MTKRFKGLNNVTDALQLGLDWLVSAENVDVTKKGKLALRSGYSRTMIGAFTGAFSTADFSRMYVVDAGTLKAMSGPDSAVDLQTGLASGTMHWTEINEQVFYNNGTDSGIIAPDNEILEWAWSIPGTPALTAVTGTLAPGQYQVCCTYTLPDGRRTGAGEVARITLAEGQGLSISSIPQVAGYTTEVYIAPANATVFQRAGVARYTAMTWNASPDELGDDLKTFGLSPLPADCDVIQAWRGRIYAAQYFPEAQQTAVWFSEPLGFHLFNLDAGFFLVPGRVLMLAPHEDALIVGTDIEIHSYDIESFKTLAPYGVVPGRHWSLDDAERVLFWSARGLCAALPFTNLTERQVSVAPGVQAGGTIVRSGGETRYLVALHRGGDAFNPFN